MPDPQPGDKICGRCDSFKATAQRIGRFDQDGKAIGTPSDADLCKRCGKIVDNAIKRAVKPK